MALGIELSILFDAEFELFSGGGCAEKEAHAVWQTSDIKEQMTS
jgi:hypothetical protein